ncbi:Glycoside hydrolase family 16 [Dillenia turbinata]|uniref:xyloglucan:xyloglucosyl transferase n=1 Tax=Dillenia turbinata TaxID=194707 RepID=A0AAN8ZTQ9_9MAGN
MAIARKYLCLLLVSSFLLSSAYAQFGAKAIFDLRPYLSFPGLPDPRFDPLQGQGPKLKDRDEDVERGEAVQGGKPDFVTNYGGSWELVAKSSGTVSMHLQILRTNKAIMIDATNFLPTQLELPPGKCRPFIGRDKVQLLDCWAHAVEFDIETSKLRPLKLTTNPWCSSGSVDPQGNLVQTGGWDDGGRAVRYLQACPTCEFEEYPQALSVQRWYGTQVILPDGGFIVIGGRRAFSYEYVPPKGSNNDPKTGNIFMELLRQTTDRMENNLYPFVHVSTDGNLFIFANTKSILFDLKTRRIVRTFPDINGGSRNYPASGMSALLPIRLGRNPGALIPAEVMICGGNTRDAAILAEQKNFLVADKTCGRIRITDPNPQWVMEDMPGPRHMADMLNLPNGEILLINGAKRGVSGWEFGEDPYFAPVIYYPNKPQGTRFKELRPTNIARMYHSSSAVLPDGKILVAGSNTHEKYDYLAKYPTELRVEKYSPPYLDPKLAQHRPKIQEGLSQKALGYGQRFRVQFELSDAGVTIEDIKVTMYAPPYTTHGYSMSQRLIELANFNLVPMGSGFYAVMAFAPPTSAVAPPGYYYLNVVHRGVPSKAMWSVAADFFKTMYINWGNPESAILNNGYDMQLVLDNTTGSGAKSKIGYLFGSIEMLIKLVPGNSAGTATTYYLSSTGNYHDEIDFEFLGNVSGQPYIIHTNIYTQGQGNREQQFYPWFNPCDDYHNYTIHWNPNEVVWYVDGVPIRVFRNYQSNGIPYPNKQGMRAYTSIWNADSWATRGGLVKIDWNSAPFIARYRNFLPRACWWQGSISINQCAANSTANWWTSPVYSQLSAAKLGQMNWVRQNYMVYDYCKDNIRFNGQMPPECSLPQY